MLTASMSACSNISPIIRKPPGDAELLRYMGQLLFVNISDGHNFNAGSVSKSRQMAILGNTASTDNTDRIVSIEPPPLT